MNVLCVTDYLFRLKRNILVIMTMALCGIYLLIDKDSSKLRDIRNLFETENIGRSNRTNFSQKYCQRFRPHPPCFVVFIAPSGKYESSVGKKSMGSVQLQYNFVLSVSKNRNYIKF